MKRLLSTTHLASACAALLASAPFNLFAVQLTADVDRDGALNPALDDLAEDAWLWERGAVFLNNNDSDLNSGEPDHADSVVNGASDFDDLARLLISQDSSLSPSATVTVSVSSASAPYVRLFVVNGQSSAVTITPGAVGNVSTGALIAGDVELLIEGNSYATGTWNGKVDVTVTVQPPSGLAQTDTVQLRVAPWLMLSNLQPADRVYLREYVGQNDAMKADLQTILPGVSASLVVSPGTDPYPSNNIWMQDAMEIGYSEMPGQRMSVVLKSNRSTSWPLSNYPKNSMLTPDFGWFQFSSYRSVAGSGNAPDGWLDWMGNLEITPPLPGYPYGKIYYGYNPATGNSFDPAIVALLNAQELQGPALAIDTGWLLIQHVDELACWVPTSSGGQKLLVPDTTLMYNLLDSWVTAGYSTVPMMTLYQPAETVGAFRNDSSFRTTNLNLQSNRINPAIETMKTAWGLSESDLIRIPAAYFSDGSSYVPNMVNNLVVNSSVYVPDPHGPIVSGQDLLQVDFQNRLSAAGVTLTVHFLDDQRYHKWSGNVHCATNTRREGFTPGIWADLTSPASVPDWHQQQH